MPTGSKHLSGKWRFLTLVLLVTAGIPVWGGATDEDQTAKEIDHLLVYIGGSTCQFIRNDKTYDAAAARSHIQKKYDYIRSRIKTAEDFIRYAASQSSMSGKPYRIRCGGETMLCADWLHAELERYRQKQ
jgi:hypothetical protein